MSGTARVHFYSGQFLRLQEFTDEQGYHLAMRRRHNVAHHTWGIVRGLELSRENDEFVLLPGFAVDGFGRELVVPYKQVIPGSAFDDKAKDRLDVYLLYGRRGSDRVPPGYGGCRETADDAAYYRWSEEPSLQTRDPDTPPAQPDADPTSDPPDEPEREWPVLLGQIQRTRASVDQPYTYAIDPSERRYAGLVAERIVGPSGLVEVRTGVEPGDPTPRFAVFARPTAEDDLPSSPQLEVDASSQVTIRATTLAEGDVSLSGGALEFRRRLSQDPPPPWSVSLYEDAAADVHELRVEILPADADRPNAFVVGSWRKPPDPPGGDEAFLPCLTVASDGTVTIAGDLVVDGQLLYGSETVPALSGDAQRAVLGGFMGGVIGTSVGTGGLRGVPLLARSVAAETPADLATRIGARTDIADVASALKAHDPALAKALRDALK
jgi:hypothetical protein